MKLLIVDDEAFIRDGLIENIDWGNNGISTVETSEDGLDAFEKSLWYRPDILLTDVKMPRVDGIELAKKIRETIPDCKIIFMSAYSDKEYLKSAIRLSALDYIEKPFMPDDLRAIIAKITNATEKEPAQNTDSRIAHNVTKLINEEYANPRLSISYICNKLYLSNSYMCITFKKHTGKTINQYINECRCEMAKMHLGNNALSLREIAILVGFSDQNYFTKVFKRIVKMTPTAYKNYYSAQ